MLSMLSEPWFLLVLVKKPFKLELSSLEQKKKELDFSTQPNAEEEGLNFSKTLRQSIWEQDTYII